MKKQRRGRSRKCSISGHIREEVRKFLSVALSVSIVAVSMPTPPAFAAPTDGDDVQEFSLTSEDLQEALKTALIKGNPIDEDAYTFNGAEQYAYEDLFYGTDVYELSPKIEDDRDGKLTLKVFARLSGDRELDSYEVSDGDEIIFLLMNRTDKEETARIYIDGYETDLIDVVPKSEVPLEKNEIEEPETEPEEEEEAEAETEAVPQEEVMAAPSAPAVTGGAAGASGGSAVEDASDSGDEIPRIEPFDDGDDEYGPGMDAAQSEDSYDGSSDTSDESGAGEDADGSYDDGSEHGGSHGNDNDAGDSGSSGDDNGGSSSENAGDSGDSENDGSSSSDNGSADSSGSSDSDSSSNDSNSTGDNGSSSGDSGSSSGDSGSSTGDSGSSSGDDGSSSRDSGSSSGDRGSSSGDKDSSSDKDGSDNDSGSQVASVSAHSIGVLAAPVGDIVIEMGGDDEDTTIYIEEDTEDIREDYSEDSEVSVASSSNADEEEETDSEKRQFAQLEGEAYEPVLVKGRRTDSSAVAFVTTVADLGMEEMSFEDVIAFTAADDGINVTVVASTGTIPNDAELSVTRYMNDSEEFAAAANAIGRDADDPNMAALDISFYDADGEEIEPEDEVRVIIDVSDILPEDADPSTLEVTHLEEKNGFFGFFKNVKPVVVAGQDEGQIDEDNAVAMFTLDSFSDFTITWTPGTGSSTSTEVTVYVYDMNGLGIYDAESDYELTADTITIAGLVKEHASKGISEDYTFVYATAQYLTTSNQGGTVTIIGSESDSVIQITWNGTSYVVTTSSGSTTVTKTDTVAAEFYINLYFSTPTVTIAPTAIESGAGNVTLTATTEYFPVEEEITYTWEIIDGDDYATITGNGATATVTWTEGDEAGEDVTVRVTATSASGATATATYELEYGMQQVTYTVYLPDGTTVVEGAHVSITDENGKLVSYGTTDANGQVTLWVTAEIEYTLEATYTASSGSGIAMSYTHYTYENKNYTYNGDGSDNTNIVLTASDANFYEHVDVKLSIADLDDEGYSDILANVDYIIIYDESGEVVYRSTQMVHNAGTNDYNVLFGDENGESRGENDHSIAFYDTYTIEIAYEVTYTYTDSNGDTASYTETYIAEINKDSTYIDGEYYSYSGTNAYQLYNELNGTDISEEDWETALQNGTMEQLLGDGYDEHGIDISGQTYFFVAAALCDTKDMGNQAGLDLALGVNSLRRYSSTAWNFEIQKTLKNAAMTEGQFSFDLYAANIDEDTTWYIDASGDADDGLQQEYTNSEASLDGGTESVTFRSGTYVFNFDSSMVGIPQTYYFVLLEKQGNDGSITYDETVYGIAVTVTLNSATDMTDVSIEESYCILEKEDVDNPEEGYIYYKVSEANPALEDDNGVTIYPFVNTYSEFTDITVEKIWVDNENAYETRPGSITVTITGSDDSTYTLTLSDSNDWKGTITDLPVYAENGSTITYEVTEETVDEYEGDVVGNGDGTYTITNTLTGETEISVDKEWVDNDNAYETRPESITVTITGSDENTYTLTLSDENDWSDTLSELPQYDSTGTKITYAVTEEEVDGYDGDVVDNGDGTYTITNTLTGETEISVEKKWVDSDDENSNRPESIAVTITGSDGNTYTLTLSDENEWSDTLSELPQYDSTGTEITYTVTEEEVTGYDGDVIDNGDGTYTITNTLQTTSISVIKVWNDDKNRDGVEPDSVQVQLKAGEEKVGEAVTLNEEDKWTYTWEDLPVYSNGEEVTYTIEEVEVPDKYTVSYSSETDDNGNVTFTMVNTHEDALTTITVNKEWKDGIDDDLSRSEVTVTLLANGKKVNQEDIEAEVTLGDENNWSYTWEGLYSFDNGELIEYTVEEVEVDGYGTEISDLTPDYDDDNNLTGYTITITNTLLGSLTVYKIWDDDGNRDGVEPDSVKVQLKAGEEKVGEAVTLNKEDEWTYTWEYLPLYSNGEKVTYTIEEVEIPDKYTVSYSSETDDDGNVAFTMVNTHEDIIRDITVNKDWQDSGDHPNEITVQLLANGESSGDSVTLGEDNGWSHTWSNVYVYEDGKEIEYTVQELEVDGYESLTAMTADEDDNYAFTVTNTALLDLTIGKDVSDLNNRSDPDASYKFEITLTNPNDTAFKGDVKVYYNDDDSEIETLTFTDGTADVELAAGDTITLTGLLYDTECTISELDSEADSVNVTVNDESTNVVTVEGETTTATAEIGKVEDTTQVTFLNSYRAYYPIVEEIVTDEDDIFNVDGWVKDEAVNEYNAIEIEMTTMLPVITAYDMENEDSEFTMNFHEVLNSNLTLYSGADYFTVYIHGENDDWDEIIEIDPQYYTVTIEPEEVCWEPDEDGNLVKEVECSFHVDVDLSALYRDGIITEDDLQGDTWMTVFFFADLEGEDMNGSYESSIWYQVKDKDTVLYTSNVDVVQVYTYEVKINKYDASRLVGDDYASAALAGATLGIYHDNDCTEPVMRAVSKDEDAKPYTAVSDENGVAMFYGLVDGTYYVQETEAPAGYILSDEVVTVELGESLLDQGHMFETYYGNHPTSSTSNNGGGGHHSGGSGGGSGSSSSSVGSDGGPGSGGDGGSSGDGETWDLLPLSATGQGRALLFGSSALAVSAMALIVLLWFKRKETRS